MKVRVFAIAGAVLLVGLGGWLVVHFSSDNSPATTQASADVTGKSKRAKNESKPTKKAVSEKVRRTSWFTKAGKAPEISDEQITAFLENSHHSAKALLAASRIKNNLEFLREAAQAFPENKTVQLEVAIRGATLDEREEAIDRYRKLDPNNAMGDYLAALIDFQLGRTENAIANLESAEQHTEFLPPSPEVRQACEDAYLSAGIGAVEAKAAALFGQPMLYATPMNQLTNYLVGEALTEPGKQNDSPTEGRLLNAGLAFSRKISGSQTLIMTDLTYLSIESRILKALPPDTQIPSLGKSATQRLEDLAQARTEFGSLGKDVIDIQMDMTEAEFLKYLQRVESEGEVSALRHLRDTGSR